MAEGTFGQGEEVVGTGGAEIGQGLLRGLGERSLVDERVSIRVDAQDVAEGEVLEYLEHRFHVRGVSGDASLCPERHPELVAEVTVRPGGRPVHHPVPFEWLGHVCPVFHGLHRASDLPYGPLPISYRTYATEIWIA